MADQWYYGRAAEIFGPVSGWEVADLAELNVLFGRVAVAVHFDARLRTSGDMQRDERRGQEHPDAADEARSSSHAPRCCKAEAI